jgi:hypothetical protein
MLIIGSSAVVMPGCRRDAAKGRTAAGRDAACKPHMLVSAAQANKTARVLGALLAGTWMTEAWQGQWWHSCSLDLLIPR